ncbi:hypothetical protein VCR14J2_270058 [Vibrio coralliirubri]|uniref:hypothetical protein n=1 Tax=Vibrio coralliirubri TaxID=1516159 RepID=UPI00063A8594|nr:hypothetical protein [Vibrio coralliirubri]CDT99298.1 hypothetical protein VCR14J2_270058 [Vibrio coralliirubri]
MFTSYVFFEGESLFSFFFRKQLVCGDLDFSNLISPLGRLYIRPIALIGRRGYLGNVRDSELLSLLEQNEIIRKRTTLFSDPTHHLGTIKRYFYHHDFPNNFGIDRDGTKELAYCSACIKENIYRSGMGYFKYEWLKGGRCTQHKTSLLLVSRSTRAKTVEALTAVISGRVPEGSVKNVAQDITATSVPLARRQGCMSRMDYFHSFVSKDSPVRMTRCLARDFYLWIKSNIDKVDDDIARKLRFANKDRFLLSFRNFRHQYEKLGYGRLACFFFIFLETNDPDLRKFLDEVSKEIDVFFGVYSPRSLSEKMLKSNRYNCSLCPRADWSKSCPASQTIIRRRAYYPVVAGYGRDMRVIIEDGFRLLTPETVAFYISKYPESRCLIYDKNTTPYPERFLGWSESCSSEFVDENFHIDIPLLSVTKQSK